MSSNPTADGLVDLAALAAGRVSLGRGPDALSVVRKHTKAFLQFVDARELHRRISAFRKLNFRSMSYSDVAQAIRDVLLFDTPNGPMAVLQPDSAQYAAGTRFYRARTIPKDDHVTPLRSMSKVSDCWEPPSEIAPIGRLNREGEPLLYTSPLNPLVAIEECKILNGEWCSLIVYEAVEIVKITVIGGDPEVEGLEDADALKLEMIQGFLRDEFTRDVGQGTEYLYRISEIIAKDYFDLPPVVHHAWCYPSIVTKPAWNVAFRPRDRQKLRLIGVQIAKPRRLRESGVAFEVGLVARAREGSDDLEYFRVGSPEQRELFPEITTRPPSVGGRPAFA